MAEAQQRKNLTELEPQCFFFVSEADGGMYVRKKKMKQK
jgi:hypothetical protein